MGRAAALAVRPAEMAPLSSCSSGRAVESLSRSHPRSVRAALVCAAAAASARGTASAAGRATGSFVALPGGTLSPPRAGAAAASAASRPAQAQPTNSVSAEAHAACLLGVAVASSSGAALRRRGRRTLPVVAVAAGEVVDVETVGEVNDGMNYMTVVPDGGVPEEDKRKVERVIYEGSEEVKVGSAVNRPSGQSQDPDKQYFWMMSKDKRTIEAVIPLPDHVEKDDLIYRLGDDPENDLNRGPPLELGYRYRNEKGRLKEKLIIDGQILNAINREDSFYMIEEMAGVKCCLLTLTRPSMLRQRHDPVLRRSYEEERIEPQTWDALLVEERIKPEITDRCFFELSLDGEPAGRLEFGLFGKLLPKTVKNFLGLVQGEYTDDEGNVVKSAHCYKGTSFSQIKTEFLISGGNPGLDQVIMEFTNEELREYLSYFEDFKMTPKKVGKVDKYWSIRWGADLGMPNPGEDEIRTEEGAAVDGNSEEELAEVVKRMRERVDRGEGGRYIFFRPEWEKGCDVSGGVFPAEDFKVPHSKRGILSMDRNVEKDVQGSNFFILLKEFPEMDKRWVAFGEVTGGWELLEKVEEGWEGKADKVKIEDCGVIA